MIFYSSEPIDNKFSSIHESIIRIIQNEREDYILNVNKIEYSKHLSEYHMIDFPRLDLDNVEIDKSETNVPAEKFPAGYDVDVGRTYKRNTVIFYVPFSGDINILKYSPSPIQTGARNLELSIENNDVLIEIIDFNGKPDTIRSEYDTFLKNYLLPKYYGLEKRCKEFNEDLEVYILRKFEEKKKKILKGRELLDSIGIRVRSNPSTSRTFSVPKPTTRKKIRIKPSASKETFKPEPTLNDSDYHEILKIIHDAGRNFEMYPSTYKGRDEEALRDSILFVLQPNFEGGTATGETFNKGGKTDILLRYESSNIFIAECKFWKGPKSFLSTIDQLLRYLTWRDSKAAIILFNKNVSNTNVLTSIKDTIVEHKNYLGHIKDEDETWFNYRVHLIGDSDREVKLAIMAYHIPE